MRYYGFFCDIAISSVLNRSVQLDAPFTQGSPRAASGPTLYKFSLVPGLSRPRPMISRKSGSLVVSLRLAACDNERNAFSIKRR